MQIQRFRSNIRKVSTNECESHLPYINSCNLRHCFHDDVDIYNTHAKLKVDCKRIC